jgi:hypothetical protein
MRQFGEAMYELPNLALARDRVFGTKTLQLLYLVIISMPAVFFIVHHAVLMRCSRVYRTLSQSDQLVVCQHAVYALVFSLSLVPQTVLAFRSLFFAWTGSYMASPELLVLIGVFVGSRSVLYGAEAMMRSVVKWSWLLVVHHLLFFTILVLGLWSPGKALNSVNGNAILVGMGIVLDLFACHEAPLYFALLAYRLQWPAKTARTILRGACVWYILTRLLQTVILVYMIVSFAGMPTVRYEFGFVITAVLCGAFTFIQAYTLVIYRAMDVKLTKRIQSLAAGQGFEASAGPDGLSLFARLGSSKSDAVIHFAGGALGGNKDAAATADA